MSQGKVRALLVLAAAVVGSLAAFGVVPEAWTSEALWSSVTAIALALPVPGKVTPKPEPKDVWKVGVND